MKNVAELEDPAACMFSDDSKSVWDIIRYLKPRDKKCE